MDLACPDFRVQIPEPLRRVPPILAAGTERMLTENGPPSGRNAGRPSRPMRILFVDDEPNMLEGLRRTLRGVDPDWQLEFVANPMEALNRIQQERFQILVTDMRMPGMDGVQLLQRVATIDADCVRLMLTGQGDVETALAAVNQGHVFRLLHKPCSRDHLVLSLELAIRQFDLQTLERDLLRSRLEQAQRLAVIGEFTAGVVHDVNNLLSVVLSLSAQDDLFEPRQALELIHDGATRAADLTRELMGFSRRDEAENSVAVNVHMVLDGCACLLRPMLGAAVTLRLEVPDDLPPIWGQPGRIKQIVTNLVVNARDASPERSTITVSVGREGPPPREAAAGDTGVARNSITEPGNSRLWISVRDTGCGMSNETLDRLFEPFFTTKGLGRGTGLGLALVRQLVDRMQGVIEVRSTLGVGTVFSIGLPMVEEVVNGEKER